MGLLIRFFSVLCRKKEHYSEYVEMISEMVNDIAAVFALISISMNFKENYWILSCFITLASFEFLSILLDFIYLCWHIKITVHEKKYEMKDNSGHCDKTMFAI